MPVLIFILVHSPEGTMPKNSRRRTALAVILSAVTVLAFIAVVIGGSHAVMSWLENHMTADETTADSDTGTTPDAMERNRIWSVMNRDCCDGPDETPDFTRMVCVALRPASDNEARRYALLALMDCGAVAFRPDELNRLVTLFRDAPIDTRINVLRGLAADSEYGISVAGLTADPTRLRQFLIGEQIPLE
jgi:hypothetical protein